MRRMRGLLTVVILVGWVGTALAQNFAVYGGEQFFKVDWRVGERWGHPAVWGYLFNDWGFTAVQVRLKVESLNAAGQVVNTTMGYVNGQVTPGTRAYFEVWVPEATPSYRVSVWSYDWIQRGGGTGGGSSPAH